VIDERTKANWQKVKAALEQSGKTNTHFYRRAVAICAGGPDPDPLKIKVI